MNLSPSPQVIEAIQLQGYLELTKSITLISYHSKHYCKILEEGRVFAYASDQKDFEKHHALVQIPLKDLLSVEMDHSHPKTFRLVTQQRVYKFLAKTTEECLKWADGLNILHRYAVEWDKKWEAYLKDLQSDLIIEKDFEHITEICDPDPTHSSTDRQRSLSLESINNNPKVNDSFTPLTPLKSNEDYLHAKGYDNVIDHIEPQILKSRIKMGYLFREPQKKPGLGLVKSLLPGENLVRRWCLLISSRSILHHMIEKGDEVVLSKGQIPLKLELDTLYMYENNCDCSGPVEVIHLKDVIQVVVKKKKDEGLYHFVLDLIERKYNIFCSSFSEMDMWLRAIQATRANIIEANHSLLPTVRNISWIIAIKDGESGEKNLRQKVEEDYERLTREEGPLKSVQDFISVQEKVASEFIGIMNACLAHRHPRTDIIKIYAEILHERILASLKNYYKKNAEDFHNGEIFTIIKFLDGYSKNLEIFGTSFHDIRLQNGIHVLSRAAARKVLRNNIRALNNVLKCEVEDEPQLDARGRLTTQNPKDIFRVLNESLAILEFCPIGDLMLQLLQVSQQALEYFQKGLESLIDENNLLTNDQLIGICNDGTVVLSEIKGFVNIARDVTAYSPQVIAENFNHKALNKATVKLSHKVLTTLSRKFFTSVLAGSKARTFLHINMLQIIHRTLQNMEDVFAKLHPIYVTKLRGAVLKQAVNFYVKNFIEALDTKQITKRDQIDVLARFNSLQIGLREGFKDLGDTTVQKILTPIGEFEDFLTRSYDLLTTGVRTLKQYYGDSLHWQTIERLIKLREQDVSKESRQQMLTMCKEIFQVTERTEKVQKDKKKKKMWNLHNEDEKEEHKAGRESWKNRTPSPSSISSKTFEDFAQRGSIPDKLDGYLIIESSFGIFSKLTGLKCFSIRKEHLHCYKNENSELSLLTINLREALSCQPAQEEKARFILKIKSKNGRTKEYKFSAENEVKRDLWVRKINSIIESPMHQVSSLHLRSSHVDLFHGDNLYKDELPLFSEPVDNTKLASFDYSRYKSMKTAASTSFSTIDLSTRTSVFQRPISSEGIFIEDDELFRKKKNYLPVAKPNIGFCGRLCVNLGLVKMKGYVDDPDLQTMLKKS